MGMGINVALVTFPLTSIIKHTICDVQSIYLYLFLHQSSLCSILEISGKYCRNPLLSRQ